MTRQSNALAEPVTLKAPPSPILDNMVQAGQWDVIAAELVRQAEVVRPEITDLERQIADLQQKLTKKTNHLADLGRQHTDATGHAALHREMAAFAAAKYSYALPDPPAATPPPPSVPDPDDPLGLGRLEQRGTPWSELPAAQGEQGAEATL